MDLHGPGDGGYFDPTCAARVAGGNPPRIPSGGRRGSCGWHLSHAPNPTSEGWFSGPSEADRLADERDGVPDLIRADDGIHLSGPESRRGGLGGGPGYPP